MNAIKSYCRCLLNKEMARGAIKVALVIGSMLLVINHGEAILTGKMNKNRWLGAGLTYVVPYCVNIHGRWASRRSESD